MVLLEHYLSAWIEPAEGSNLSTETQVLFFKLLAL